MAALLAGQGPIGLSAGAFDSLVTASVLPKALLFIAGDVLVGFGARLAGGCTSGHGIVGTALGARASLVAIALFFVGGVMTTVLLAHL